MLQHMKRITLILAALMLFVVGWRPAAYSQSAAEALSNPELPTLWIGLDFSLVKYIGDPGTVSPGEMKRLFSGINNLVVNEPENFRLPETFRKNHISIDLGITEHMNSKIDADKLQSYRSEDARRLKPEDIAKAVQKYSFRPDDNGIAIVFVMEGLNKMFEQGTMWATYLDIKTKKVLFTERVEGKAVGFGFRNHWAGSVREALEHIDRKLMREWKNAFETNKK
jgi:hypothetical protein